MELNESNNSFNTNESLDEIKRKIENKVYTVSLKKDKGKLWEVFGKIVTDTGEIFSALVACRKCSSILKYNKALISNLVKHKCYRIWRNKPSINPNPIETETKKNMECLVLQWTIENCRPIDVIEDSGLQKVAKYLIATGAKYGAQVDMEELLPKPAALSKNVAKLHMDYVVKLKNDLKPIRSVGYALTIGVWNDDYLYASHLFLTIHYINGEEFVNRFLGLKSTEKDKCTSKVVRLMTEEILNKFDCTLDDKPLLVTDDSEKMVKAFQKDERVYCINYLLQRTLEAAIDGTPDVKETCEQSVKLFNFLRNISTSFANPFENDPTKRWQTILHMLSSICLNYKEIINICISNKEEELRIIERLNLSQIKELINILENFEEVSKELECDDGPTLHMTVALMHRLRKMCIKNVDDGESTSIKKFKVNLLSHFETNVWKNMTLQHKVALYLFPPAKKLVSLSQSDKYLVRAECQRIMQTFVVEEAPVTRIAYKVIQIDSEQTADQLCEIKVENIAKKSQRTMKDTKIFEDFMDIGETLNNTEERVKCEMRLYEDTNVILHDNFNLMQWWEVHKLQFPLLYKTSCKILATPATCAASVKAILKARPLIFENCSLVDGNAKPINELMFLHCNVEKKTNV